MPERSTFGRFDVHNGWKYDGVGSALPDHVGRRARAEGFETSWVPTDEDHPDLRKLNHNRCDAKPEHGPLEYREYDGIVMANRLDDSDVRENEQRPVGKFCQRSEFNIP